MGRSANINHSSVSGGTVSGSQSVGGLVGQGDAVEIRYSSASGGTVIGRGSSVGGLVGYGPGTQIRYSSASGGNVSGRGNVGGLVGYGLNSNIHHSSASGGTVSGRGSSVGGLVGSGDYVEIHHSSASGGNVSGHSLVGGLVGYGERVEIHHSSASGGSVSGSESIGGLVGYGLNSNINHSYASGGAVTGRGVRVGGLLGFGVGSNIRYSYASGGPVSGTSNVGGLIGLATGATVIASYWDIDTTKQLSGGVDLLEQGERQTTADLQSPTNFDGSIYALWGNFWCDPRTGNVTETTAAVGPGAPFIRLWDLGTGFQYPALSCLPGGLSAQGRVDAFPEDACASADTDRDGKPDSLVAGCQTNLTADPDDDNDGMNDFATDGITQLDACPRGETGWTSNASTDYDGDGCRDGFAEETDDDHDGVADEEDAFPEDACASADTDEDGKPDSLVAGCQTNLTADPDDDNDGVADEEDAFPEDACASADTDEDGMPDTVVTSCQTDLTADPDYDHDNDSTPDVTDVDDDNNGLIEIRTLEGLARLRDDLNGDGADDGNIGEITVVSSAGCPSSGCVGYELTRSLNFSQELSYEENSGNPAVWTSGSGWKPIGSCSDRNVCTAYAGMFDGGGYAIADLFISAGYNKYGVGLFGAFNGSIHNLHLQNVRVSGRFRTSSVGGLVGYGKGGRYENLSVMGGSVMSVSGQDVGGLVGFGSSADIRNADVSGVSVSGRYNIGGLVGYGGGADIRNADVSGGNVAGLSDRGSSSRIGGLIGAGYGSDIRYASVYGVSVSGSSDIGGLVGASGSADIRNAYVSGGSVNGSRGVGGLVGDGRGADILYAYAAPGLVSGSGDNIGGLIGKGGAVTASYWDTQTTGQPIGAGHPGGGKTTAELQSPTGFTGIYTAWGNFWCDPNTGDDVIEDTSVNGPGGSFVRLWDLGTSSQYPALNCLPGGLSAQGRDAFPLDACASLDTDHDGMPDTVVAGCQTDLTADPDDDNDGVNDIAPDGIIQLDACPRGETGWTSNASTDYDGDGCRDDSIEDPDDDNDGVNDFATDGITRLDACPRGETGWTSNASADHDGDGCRDSTEDPDDDNDDVADEEDAFPEDACASADTDEDGMPDTVVTGCQTDLTADPDYDHDNDSTPDVTDVDDDNNGLIEIRTLDGLARLRDDLDGNGTDDGEIGEITAVGSAGCPDSGCVGYELTRSLNFSDAGSYEENSDNLAVWTNRSGSGWEPIGFCISRNDCTAYTGIFDGRDYTLADLFVSAANDANGVGLFAAF